jgi:hypothetical protein
MSSLLLCAISTRRSRNIDAMKDERDIDTEQPPKDAGGEPEAPEIAEDDEPGVTDFLKAAKDGAKHLKNLEP